MTQSTRPFKNNSADDHNTIKPVPKAGIWLPSGSTTIQPTSQAPAPPTSTPIDNKVTQPVKQAVTHVITQPVTQPMSHSLEDNVGDDRVIKSIHSSPGR